MQDLLTLNDLTKNEILNIFRHASMLKKKPFNTSLRNKVIALLFEKPSTRTRVSFQAGIAHLGGTSLFLREDELQIIRGETVEDTGRVLEKYVDCIVARVYQHKTLEKFAESTNIPVINALSDLYHPCQSLADLYTILIKFRKLKGLKISYFGDGENNVTHSLMIGCAKLGAEITVCSPKGYLPDKKVLSITKGSYILESDPKKAAEDADVLYTDTWVSMGDKKGKRLRDLSNYQLNKGLVSLANKRAIVMHCLPAHRGYEITTEVMEGNHSVIFDQAENRMHVQKALLMKLL